MPSFSSLEIGPVVVSLVFPVRGLAGLCFVDLGLLAGARACRCCPGPPRWRWSGLSWLPCALLAGACGRSSLPSSSLRGVVGLCFGARCSPRWWLGRSLLPSSSLLGWVGCASLPACSSLELGPFGVALVLLAVGGRVCRCCPVFSSLVRGAGRCCPRPPCWGWLGCVSGPLFSSLEIGPVVVALVSPVRGWLGCASLPSSPRWCLGPVVGAIVLLAGGGWAVFRCPSLLVLLAGVWACLCCPRPPCWGGWGVFRCRCSPRWGSGRSALPSSSPCGGWLGCASLPSCSSLEFGPVGVALWSPRWRWGLSLVPCVLLGGAWGRSLLPCVLLTGGLACRCCPPPPCWGWLGLCFGALVLLAGDWGCRCCPRLPRVGVGWAVRRALVLLAGAWGRSVLPWSSSLEVVGTVVVAVCSPCWRVGPVVVALVLLAGGGWVVFRCPCSPCWCLGPVVVALVLLAGDGWAVRRCPRAPRRRLGRSLVPSSSLLGVAGHACVLRMDRAVLPTVQGWVVVDNVW